MPLQLVPGRVRVPDDAKKPSRRTLADFRPSPHAPHAPHSSLPPHMFIKASHSSHGYVDVRTTIDLWKRCVSHSLPALFLLLTGHGRPDMPHQTVTSLTSTANTTGSVRSFLPLSHPSTAALTPPTAPRPADFSPLALDQSSPSRSTPTSLAARTSSSLSRSSSSGSRRTRASSLSRWRRSIQSSGRSSRTLASRLSTSARASTLRSSEAINVPFQRRFRGGAETRRRLGKVRRDSHLLHDQTGDREG